MHRRTLHVDGPLDPRATLAPVVAGRRDPSARLDPDSLRIARRTVDGPASLELSWRGLDPRRGGDVTATAWGPGAAVLLEDADRMLGLADDPSVLARLCRRAADGTDAATARSAQLVAAWTRALPGLRFPRVRPVTDQLVATILGQVVQGVRAERSWAALVRAHGTAAPGPAPVADLVVPPAPALLASLPYEAYHRFDVERRRADIIRRAASVAHRVEEIGDLEPADAEARLRALPGVGPWTAAVTLQVTVGDPDAVVLADYHLPAVVAHALTGERTADDERMLELLAPFTGQRARVQRLAARLGTKPPRRGPRLSLEPITAR